MAKHDAMVEAQKKYSEEKVKYAKEVIDMMVAEGEAVTPYAVIKKSKLAKSFIYTNEEIMAYIQQFRSEKKYNYSKFTEEDAYYERIQLLERENTELRKQLKFYKQESMESLLFENQLLRHRLRKYEELEAQGLISLPKNEE